MVSSSQLTVPNLSTPRRSGAAAAATAPARPAGAEAAAASVVASKARRVIIASDIPPLVRELAFPAHHPAAGMLPGPFGDLRRRQEHALGQRPAALEIEVLDPAVRRLGDQADRQHQIDHVHARHLHAAGSGAGLDLIAPGWALGPVLKVPDETSVAGEAKPIPLPPSTRPRARGQARSVPLTMAFGRLASSKVRAPWPGKAGVGAA